MYVWKINIFPQSYQYLSEHIELVLPGRLAVK